MKRFAIMSTLAAAGALAASAGEMVAFTDIDANGDGSVSESEFVTYKIAEGEHSAQEASEMFLIVDADANGSVSKAEFTAAKEAWKRTDAEVDADVELDVQTDTGSSY